MRKLVRISFVVVDIEDEPRPTPALGNQGGEAIDGLGFAEANHIWSIGDGLPRQLECGPQRSAI
jgi:hypothetical protein